MPITPYTSRVGPSLSRAYPALGVPSSDTSPVQTRRGRRHRTTTGRDDRVVIVEAIAARSGDCDMQTANRGRVCSYRRTSTWATQVQVRVRQARLRRSSRRSYYAMLIGTSRSLATATDRFRHSCHSALCWRIFARWSGRNPASSAGFATRRRTALGLRGLWTYRWRREPSSYLFNRWNL